MASYHSEVVNVSIPKSDAELATTELFIGYPEPLLHFAYACCIIFMAIGIPGNLITIVALASCKKFQNATAVFIISLHISNLLCCCIVLPMATLTYLTKKWILGHMMCNVYPLLKYSLNATAHFTVVAITLNRYILVCHPFLYPKFYKKRNIIISLLSIWIAAFALFLPAFFGVWGQFDLEPIGGSCTLLPDNNKVSPKKFFLCIAFLGPSILIVICYGRIWWIVRQTSAKFHVHNPAAIKPSMKNCDSDASAVETGHVGQEPEVFESSTDNDTNRSDNTVASSPSGRETVVNFFKVSHSQKDKIPLPTRKDKKLATMIVAIIVSYALCHLPLMITRLIYCEYKMNPLANVLAHLLDYSSFFLNSLIYVIMSSEYRQAYTSLFHSLKSKFMSCLT